MLSISSARTLAPDLSLESLCSIYDKEIGIKEKREGKKTTKENLAPRKGFLANC